MANHGLHRISFGEDMRLKALLEYVQEKVKIEHRPDSCGLCASESALTPGNFMNE